MAIPRSRRLHRVDDPWSLRRPCGIACLVALCGLPSLPLGAQDVILSEVMAVNDQTLADARSETSDWIELFNQSAAPVSLDGWALTDDSRNLRQWIFPEVTIGPGAHLVVFASGRDQRDPARELHTNFSLSAEGEFLALSDAEGIVVSAFAPRLPPQVGDVSYGPPMEVAAKKLVAAGSTARYLVPTSDDLGNAWRDLGFDDAAWGSGPTGIGFDATAERPLADLIATDVGEAVADTATSVFVRIPFTADAADVSLPLLLRMQYNDGYVAFLNGVEVARGNFRSTTLRYSSRASTSRSPEDTRTVEEVRISAGSAASGSALQPGQNILAIHLLRYRNTDLDMLLVPELEGLRVTSVGLGTPGYFTEPTPGWPNGGSVLSGLTGPPTFSFPSGAYGAAISLELIPPSADAEIRYSLDARDPTVASPLYTVPITVDRGVCVRARAFRPGLVPSAVAAETYILVDSQVLSFTSNIPVVFCSTVSATRPATATTPPSPAPIGNNCGGGAYYPGYFMIFSPEDDGRSRITEAPDVAELAGFRKRGSSTCGRPKFSFNVEVKVSLDPDNVGLTTDPLGRAKDMEIFGMSDDADWVMYGPYNFDRALMRNAIAYWMSREVGPWAAKTRFVECFFANGTAGPVRMNQYFGVYVFMERCKQHPDRIDVEPLGPLDNAEPEVAGGYALKRDRIGAGEVSTSAGGYDSLVFVYPRLPTAQQRAWITSYMNRAIASLTPNIGSQADSDLIDVREWLDHHILNWYPKNVDAFRLSGYMYKRRDGLMVMGPVWDYDRTMGCSDDDRAAEPTGWNNRTSGDGGTLYFQAGGLGSWYSKLFNNVPPTGNDPWAKAYRARWRELRSGPLETAHILAKIDEWAAELSEAGVRNFTRWPETRPRFANLQGEVNHLKNWLSQRADWIDSQFVEPPALTPPGGMVAVGTQVTLAASEGQIYYTLDGTDPKTAAGGLGPSAVLYSGPIVVTENVKVSTRLRVGAATWSELVASIYVTSVPPLRVTEVMYNAMRKPEDPYLGTNYEFLEVYNAGTEPIGLEGVEVVRPGFKFSGSAVTSIDPGEYVVVVDDLTAFRARYGEGPKVAGAYSGSLSNTRQEIELRGSIGETILKFQYEDSWYPETDGQGPSLVVVDGHQPLDLWNLKEGWKASAEVDGSPGRADSAPSDGLQLPGDFSQDGKLTITDGIGVLLYLYSGYPSPCAADEGTEMLLDVNGDGIVNLTDAVHTLHFLFLHGEPPALGVGCVRMPGCPDACVR